MKRESVIRQSRPTSNALSACGLQSNVSGFFYSEHDVDVHVMFPHLSLETLLVADKQPGGKDMTVDISSTCHSKERY